MYLKEGGKKKLKKGKGSAKKQQVKIHAQLFRAGENQYNEGGTRGIRECTGQTRIKEGGRERRWGEWEEQSSFYVCFKHDGKFTVKGFEREIKKKKTKME